MKTKCGIRRWRGAAFLRLEPLKTLLPQPLSRSGNPGTDAESGGRYGTYINIYGNQPASVLPGRLHRVGLDLRCSGPGEGTSAEGPEGKRVFLREWEAAREGVDDLRYLQTLEEALASGKARTLAAWADAQKPWRIHALPLFPT